MDSVEDQFVETRWQCAEAWSGHDVPGVTVFPMSQNAHFIMYVSDSGVGAERFLSLQNADAFRRHPCRPRLV